MREKRSALVIKKEHIRITPASAGKTLEKEEKNQRVREKPKVTSSTFLKQQDYPRVCGKNMSEVSKELPPAGSPPRVREKRFLSKPATCTSGITPACAGKTYERLQSPQSDQDHPRVCGKNALPVGQLVSSEGSPPRVREKLNINRLDFQETRITPASAGKTPTSASGISSTKDHPRECGKNHVFLIAVLQISGSPPRVREKL